MNGMFVKIKRKQFLDLHRIYDRRIILSKMLDVCISQDFVMS